MTAKVKKIISEIDRLDAKGKAAVRRHLAAGNGHPKGGGKRLTHANGNGYNAAMPITAKPPTTAPNGVGRKIAELREAKGLSQVELAAEVGISQPSVWNIENGQRGIRSTTLRCIAEALGTTADELLSGV